MSDVDDWECRANVISLKCPKCAEWSPATDWVKKPENNVKAWLCECGARNTSRHCTECGMSHEAWQPEPETCRCCHADVVKWRDHWHRKWEAAELELYKIKKAYNAMCGPRAHKLGCDCGGMNRSGYTCKQFHDLMKKD